MARVKGGTTAVSVRLQSNLLAYAAATTTESADRSARLRELLAAGVRAEAAADPTKLEALMKLRETQP